MEYVYVLRKKKWIKGYVCVCYELVVIVDLGSRYG